MHFKKLFARLKRVISVYLFNEIFFQLLFFSFHFFLFFRCFFCSSVHVPNLCANIYLFSVHFFHFFVIRSGFLREILSIYYSLRSLQPELENWCRLSYAKYNSDLLYLQIISVLHKIGIILLHFFLFLFYSVHLFRFSHSSF